jgi:hypothetical protein
LAEAFSPDSYAPEQTAELAGSACTLHFEDGRVVEFRFESGSRLAWKTSEATSGTTGYFALNPRDGVYFVSLVTGESPPTTMVLVIDTKRRFATTLVASLPESVDVRESLSARASRGDELTAVTADFAAAAVDAPFTEGTPRHETTTDLLGRRVEYTYSPTERYEHIYLNERFYTWHCLLGSERGLADTDRCHYLKLGEDLYLFVWREKIVPTLGAVVVDFKAMRTMGKIFGHGVSGPADFPVGARARLENITVHGEAIWP